jgi:hypothetical protein
MFAENIKEKSAYPYCERFGDAQLHVGQPLIVCPGVVQLQGVHVALVLY